MGAQVPAGKVPSSVNAIIGRPNAHFHEGASSGPEIVPNRCRHVTHSLEAIAGHTMGPKIPSYTEPYSRTGRAPEEDGHTEAARSRAGRTTVATDASGAITSTEQPPRAMARCALRACGGTA